MTPAVLSRLKEIKAREQAATPGPWHVGHYYKSDIDSRFGRVADAGLTRGPQGETDAEFIAHAREDLPFLLAQVEAQAAEIELLTRRSSNHESQWQYMVEDIAKAVGVGAETPVEALDHVRGLVGIEAAQRARADTFEETLKLAEKALRGLRDEVSAGYDPDSHDEELKHGIHSDPVAAADVVLDMLAKARPQRKPETEEWGSCRCCDAGNTRIERRDGRAMCSECKSYSVSVYGTRPVSPPPDGSEQ